MKRTPTYFLVLCVLLLCGSGMRAQEQPAPAQEPPAPQAPQPPPLPPRPKDVKMPDEGKIAVGVWGWFPRGTPIYDKGKGTFSTEASLLHFGGEPKYGRGADILLPAGGHNAIRVSYFDTKAAGNVTTGTELNLWSTGFAAGDYLATQYQLKAVKFSYDFVTWPYPVGSRRFRLKTLWQVQYVSVKSQFSAPLSLSDTSIGSGSKSIILPTLGLGMADYLSQHFRVEANASGMGFPHRAAIWDTDASAAYRVGRLELRVGVKGYHFKTSPKADFYMRGTLVGAFAGVRFFLN